MSPHETAALVQFAAVLGVLLVAHDLADHVIGQTDTQAEGKGAATAAEVAAGANPRRGWGQCLAHVAQCHLVLAVVLVLVWAALPLPLGWTGLAAGFAWSMAAHALLDRRWPVRWVLEHVGSKGFADLRSHGLNGLYLTEQALHRTALLISAALITQL